MIVTWEIDDGYCGKSRPQHTEIPDDELELCKTENEKEDLIEGYIQDDFNSNISWCETSRE